MYTDPIRQRARVEVIEGGRHNAVHPCVPCNHKTRLGILFARRHCCGSNAPSIPLLRTFRFCHPMQIASARYRHVMVSCRTLSAFRLSRRHGNKRVSGIRFSDASPGTGSTGC
ncbi:hypothetical protein BC628DRAFT_1394193 [Trametes gibbosa]|nr:hypothetical protein BC628DRAFT_1394193 [Trametes gibbosa]